MLSIRPGAGPGSSLTRRVPVPGDRQVADADMKRTCQGIREERGSRVDGASGRASRRRCFMHAPPFQACSALGAPHSTLGAPSSRSSALGLALRVHRVVWPPQGSVGPVLMPSLGAGRRNRPELPHVSSKGQHGLRPEAALHWVRGHPGGHHGCVHSVSAQAQHCERGLPR